MEIPSIELHRLCYNASLYAHKDSMVKGLTLWGFTEWGVYVTTFDDYFALTDRYEHPTGRKSATVDLRLMELKTLKELEKDLRDSDTAWTEDDLKTLMVEDYPEEIMSLVQEVDDLCLPVMESDPCPIYEFALSPDRLRKLSWIKPGDYPIDCRSMKDDKGNTYLAFKCGPTVQGAMSLMDRDKLKTLYSNNEVWS